MQQAQDFLDESRALADVLEPLSDAEFDMPTLFKGWSIDDVIGHLHMFNVAALKTLQDDEAFAALPAATVEDLLKPENKDQLIAVLTYHVVPGKIMSADIAGKTAEVATVQGSDISVNATNGVMVDSATVVTADIEADNGVIHVIDQVVLPN